MPIMQIAKKTQVPQDFIDLYKDMVLRRYKTIMSKRKTISSYQLSYWDRDNMPTLGRLKSILQDKDVWDKELTKLRTLPFVAFGTYTDGDRTYLCVETSDILLEDPNNQCKWNMGHYLCYLNSSIAENGLSDSISSSSVIHWVPAKAPWTYARHPHHKACNYDIAGHVYKVTHPTQMFANTCWGSFGSVATLSTNVGDYTELLRILHIYCTRYNPHSSLGFSSRVPYDAPERPQSHNINGCDWKTKTNIEYHEEVVRIGRRYRR